MMRSTFRCEQVGRTRVSGLDFSIPSANELGDLTMDDSSAREVMDHCPSWSAALPDLCRNSNGTGQSLSLRSSGYLDMVVEEQYGKYNDSMPLPLPTTDSSKSIYSTTIDEDEDSDDLVPPTVPAITEPPLDDAVVPEPQPDDDTKVVLPGAMPSTESSEDSLDEGNQLENGYVSA